MIRKIAILTAFVIAGFTGMLMLKHYVIDAHQHDHHDHDHHGMHAHSHEHSDEKEAHISPQQQRLLDREAALNAAIQQRPDDLKSRTALAETYVQLARMNGDHNNFVHKALRVADNTLDIAPENTEARMIKISVLLTLHQFENAKMLAESLAKEFPHNAFVYGALCDANVELGNYSEAVAACDKMLSIRPDLRSYSRASYLREIHGDMPGAIAAMKLAVKSGVHGSDERNWALCQLANLYLQTGDVENAEKIFSGVLELQPDRTEAIFGLADIASINNGLGEGISVLETYADHDADHIIIEKLALMYVANGNDLKAAEMIAHAAEGLHQQAANGWNVDLELARFYADCNVNLDEALSHIEREYQRRPENIDVLATYAWVQFRRGEVQKALPLMKKALRMETERPVYWYHAAEIYSAAGDLQTAQNYLKLCKSDKFLLPAQNLESARELEKRLHQFAQQAQFTPHKRQKS